MDWNTLNAKQSNVHYINERCMSRTICESVCCAIACRWTWDESTSYKHADASCFRDYALEFCLNERWVKLGSVFSWALLSLFLGRAGTTVLVAITQLSATFEQRLDKIYQNTSGFAFGLDEPFCIFGSERIALELPESFLRFDSPAMGLPVSSYETVALMRCVVVVDGGGDQNWVVLKLGVYVWLELLFNYGINWVHHNESLSLLRDKEKSTTFGFTQRLCTETLVWGILLPQRKQILTSERRWNTLMIRSWAKVTFFLCECTFTLPFTGEAITRDFFVVVKHAFSL